MKKILLLFVFNFWLQHSIGQLTTLCPEKDLKNLPGNWNGSLTYLDYTSGKNYTMEAKLKVKNIDSETYLFCTSYPDEPKANATDTLKISNDGKSINTENIVSVLKKRKQIEITTEEKSKDGNDQKEALIKHTYSLSKKSLLIKKEVQFAGHKEWIIRNIYSYTK